MKTTSLKKIVVWKVVGIIVIGILVGVIYFLGNQVQGVRRGLLVKQISLEGSLKAAVFQASLQEQLVEHKVEINRIEQMMPVQDEIGSIIGSFEVEAKKSGVIVTVPKVEEMIVVDKNGEKVVQVGSTRIVRMQIHAQGEPVALITFMHAIEHMPLLLGTVSFVLISDADSVRGGLGISVPGSRPPGAEVEKTEPRRASLRLEVELTTRVEGST